MKIRRAEGRGSEDPAYYRALLSGRAVANSRGHVPVSGVAAAARTGAGYSDIGAGNGWLSKPAGAKGHRPVAVDIFTDGLDGLGAARHYGMSFPLVEAEFDRLPFVGRQSIGPFSTAHSTTRQTTGGRWRKLCAVRPTGQILILDSPVGKRREHGERMREERHQHFERPTDSCRGQRSQHRVPVGSAAAGSGGSCA
jgi:hypothetical protein